MYKDKERKKSGTKQFADNNIILLFSSSRVCVCTRTHMYTHTHT